MFKALPIGRKVVGLVSISLLLMLAVATYSFFQTRELREEVVDLSDELIPLVNALTTVDARTLEQERILERTLRRLRDVRRNSALLEKDRERFRALGGEVQSSMHRAERLAATGATKARVVEDAVELARVQVFLQGLRKEYRSYHKLAQEVLRRYEQLNEQEESPLDVELRLNLEERLDASEDQLEASVAEVLGGLEQFTENRAKRLRKSEEAFFILSLEQLALAVFAFLLGIAVAAAITRRIVRPLHDLVNAAHDVTRGDLSAHVRVHSSDEVGKLGEAFNRMVDELRSRERIKEAFGKYVDPRIVENLIDDMGAVQSEGERQIMTVMFSDVARFSQLSERMTPSGLVKVINRYLTLATEPIAEHHGVVDKYIGDAIMAFWGPPFTTPKEHAHLACTAALAQFDQLERFRAMLPELLGFRKGIVDIDIRVGLCTGDLVVGNIGSDRSKSFTVMGDTVNIASRLEGANKAYGTRILMAESTHRLIKNDFDTREIDTLQVVGKEESVRVFELVAKKGELAKPALELHQHFEIALEAYRAQQWTEATQHFEHCLEIRSDDAPSQTFLRRVEELQKHPPGPDWDGVWRMQSK